MANSGAAPSGSTAEQNWRRARRLPRKLAAWNGNTLGDSASGPSMSTAPLNQEN